MKFIKLFVLQDYKEAIKSFCLKIEKMKEASEIVKSEVRFRVCV